MSQVMFWVGLLFVLTPILVVVAVVLTTRYLRKKRQQADPQPTP